MPNFNEQVLANVNAKKIAVKGINQYVSHQHGGWGEKGLLPGDEGEGCGGIWGESTEAQGVYGKSVKQEGVYGESDHQCGVKGKSIDNIGVMGSSTKSSGVYGTSTESAGVSGISHKSSGVNGHSEELDGVRGESTKGSGITGIGNISYGVFGKSDKGIGVEGDSTDSNGVVGKSVNSDALVGSTSANGKAGVLGLAPNGNAIVGISDNGAGLWVKGKLASHFEGDVEVTGDIKLINGDVAEDFSIANYNSVFPGSVMTLKEDGTLEACNKEYDKKVAGVISGAGSYKPALILDKKNNDKDRMPIALMGKVFCQVDASFGSIEIGDLLTTSPTTGHAMKADNPFKAFGAVIGKALRPLSHGKGFIPILVTLQ